MIAELYRFGVRTDIAEEVPIGSAVQLPASLKGSKRILFWPNCAKCLGTSIQTIYPKYAKEFKGTPIVALSASPPFLPKTDAVKVHVVEQSFFRSFGVANSGEPMEVQVLDGRLISRIRLSEVKIDD